MVTYKTQNALVVKAVYQRMWLLLNGHSYRKTKKRLSHFGALGDICCDAARSFHGARIRESQVLLSELIMESFFISLRFCDWCVVDKCIISLCAALGGVGPKINHVCFLCVPHICMR